MQDEVLRDPRETGLSKRAERLQSKAETVVKTTAFLPAEAKNLILDMAALLAALAQKTDHITPYLDEGQ